MSKSPDEVRRRVQTFMKAEFPQIEMHGGSTEIVDYEHSEGRIEILLSDACDGCGISPMTIQALKRRMPRSIDEIESVDAKTGEGEELGSITDGQL